MVDNENLLSPIYCINDADTIPAEKRAEIMVRAGASVKKPIAGGRAANYSLMTNEPETPRDDRPKFRLIIHWRIIVLGWLIGLLLHVVDDYRPDAIDLATAPYRFSALSWELSNLPDKWLRRAVNGPKALVRGDDMEQRAAEVDQYFEIGLLLRQAERLLIEAEALEPLPPELAAEAAELRQRQVRAREIQSQLRPRVEETVESAVADTLKSLGFQARILSKSVGVFPPVDTVLTGSPTVLITSPRDRIARGDDVVLRTGLTKEQREEVEASVESQTGLSALVVNTGGIAFYPSITLPDAGLDFALEVIAHEWVHQWLWFRPLGKHYFEGGLMTVINETVADIAGREIGELALSRLEGAPPPQATHPAHGPTPEEHQAATEPAPFDFQAEMRATRIRVDELLAGGDVAGAEAYMEERRRAFVENGYLIRRLNQAYFAFNGTYATTGAAGVSVIGEYMEELRRRSPSLAHFLRTAAEISNPADLSNMLDNAAP